jgi:hypothetical protein
VTKPKVQVKPQTTNTPIQPEPLQKDAGTFSDDEIRTRAYQIYESRDRNLNQAEEDWSQPRSS